MFHEIFSCGSFIANLRTVHVTKFALQKYNLLLKKHCDRCSAYEGSCASCIPITCLKCKQYDALVATLNNDVIAVLPTGYGKSLIFFLLPYVVDRGLVFIISPLDAIISQHQQHVGRCLTLTNATGLTRDDIAQTDYLIGHPEHFLGEDMWGAYNNSSLWEDRVLFIVVDECHCVQKWGKDFRKQWSNIHQLRAKFPGARVLTLSATMSVTARSDLASSLHLKNPVFVTSSIDRPNINLSAKRVKAAELLDVVDKLILELSTDSSFVKTVVYCKLDHCGRGFEKAVQAGVEDLVLQYHAKCTKESKREVEDMFAAGGTVKLLFATEAYSMGVDVHDIRRIIFIGSPATIESYMQALGRAGRDGQPAVAILYYSNADLGANVKHMTDTMRAFCRTGSCRREMLLNYFGQSYFDRPSPTHKCCDNCVLLCECSLCVPLQ